MKYKLIAADMDGTLLNDELTVSQANIDAVKRYRAAGGIFTIATGRAPCGVERYLKALGFDDTPVKLICNIGGAIVESDTLKTVKIFAMQSDEASQLVRFLEENTRLVMAYAEDGLKISARSALSDMYCEKVGIGYEEIPELALFVRSADVKIAKVMAILDEREIQDVMRRLDGRFPELHCLQSTAPFLKTLRRGDEDFMPAMLECTPRGVSKGAGLKYVADSYGIPMSQVMAFGDSFNDADMIKTAGMGVAMGNACEPVKQLADYVAPTNNDDGVAKTVARFCFGDNSNDGGSDG